MTQTKVVLSHCRNNAKLCALVAMQYKRFLKKFALKKKEQPREKLRVSF